MAGRRLSPDERAVWSRVTASVRTHGKTVRPPLVDTARGIQTVFDQSSTASVIQPKSPRRSGIAVNTLDGSWDKRLASGAAAPERAIDLHGSTLAQAHARLLHGLDMAVADGVRVLLVVTGRAPRTDASRLDLPLRGIIRASIGDWLMASRYAGRIAAVRGAHPRHGGAGALYIIFRRPAGRSGASNN